MNRHSYLFISIYSLYSWYIYVYLNAFLLLLPLPTDRNRKYLKNSSIILRFFFQTDLPIKVLRRTFEVYLNVEHLTVPINAAFTLECLIVNYDYFEEYLTVCIYFKNIFVTPYYYNELIAYRTRLMRWLRGKYGSFYQTSILLSCPSRRCRVLQLSVTKISNTAEVSKICSHDLNIETIKDCM